MPHRGGATHADLPGGRIDGAPLFQWISRSPEATRSLGYELGRRLEGGEVICLTGPLGAGKTCLTQGIAAGLGIEEVGSPSYVLIAQFHGRLTLFHVDAYRLTPDDPSLSDTGIDECLTDAGVCVIEWADRIVSWLPPAFLEIRLDHLPQGRLVQIRPEGTRYHTLAKDLRSRVCAWH